MSSIKLSPNASGTGIFTIAAPNSNTDRTLNLPDQSGTIISTDSSGAVILPRVDSSNEGGQINFNRASDNTAVWSIDSFGSTSTPTLRFINGATVAAAIDGSNNVGIGTSTPSTYGTGLSIYRNTTDGTSSALNLVNAGATGSYAGVYITAGSVTFQQFGDAAGNAIGTAGVMLRTTSNHPLLFGTNSTERARITAAGQLQTMVTGGSSVMDAYGCRAWVNFNGTGTVAIRGSGNVSSITDNGTGDYTVNFTTAMPDANYAVSTGLRNNPAVGSGANAGLVISTSTAQTTSAVRVTSGPPSAGTLADYDTLCVSIFR